MAESPEHRIPIRWLAAPLVLVFGTAAVGNALAPALLGTHPLLLLALNATTRHLVLTSTSVDVVPWAAVGLARRLLEDPFLFLIGRWYGDDALAWIDAKAGGARWLPALRRTFRWAGYPLVALVPGGVVCLLAGIGGMGVATFLVLNVAGTIATLWLLRSTGESLAGPIETVVGFSTEHWLPLTLATAAITGAALLRRRRRPGPQLPG